MNIEFCIHGNVVGLTCSQCNPNAKSKEKTMDEQEECPVWRLTTQSPTDFQGNPIPTDDVACENAGVSVRPYSARQEMLECTSCGYSWRRWKKSKDSCEMNPVLIQCTVCNRVSVEPSSRSSASTCSNCGRAYAMEQQPTWFNK